jgi:hypothetical protein
MSFRNPSALADGLRNLLVGQGNPFAKLWAGAVPHPRIPTPPEQLLNFGAIQGMTWLDANLISRRAPFPQTFQHFC